MTRTKRYEFSKSVKRAALRRSGGLCEAVGKVYGLAPKLRCNWTLAQGVEFDHYPMPATDPGSDSLENCMAVCPSCHRHKTRTFDVPAQAKSKRVRDKHLGIREARQPMPSRGFQRPTHKFSRAQNRMVPND